MAKGCIADYTRACICRGNLPMPLANFSATVLGFATFFQLKAAIAISWRKFPHLGTSCMILKNLLPTKIKLNPKLQIGFSRMADNMEHGDFFPSWYENSSELYDPPRSGRRLNRIGQQDLQPHSSARHSNLIICTLCERHLNLIGTQVCLHDTLTLLACKLCLRYPNCLAPLLRCLLGEYWFRLSRYIYGGNRSFAPILRQSRWSLLYDVYWLVTMMMIDQVQQRVL